MLFKFDEFFYILRYYKFYDYIFLNENILKYLIFVFG